MSLSKNPPRESSRDRDEGIIASCYRDWCRAPGKAYPFIIYAKQNGDANTASLEYRTGGSYACKK